ncbi:MAG: aldo/keto reductase [Novosphingobium sp.]|nr:aldo/keto reductase [Novosphingobium sp.]
MKSYQISGTDLAVSRISFGCASLGGWNKGVVDADTARQAESLIRTAHEQGITLFDHADFYGFGNGELAFGGVLKRNPGLREQLVIQSKCGQLMPGDPEPTDPYRVDLSRNHIVASVEGSLMRLNTDHLDILLLHVPDALMDPSEVGEAFAALKQSGKVRHFGVSNYSAAKIAWLQKHIDEPLVINQVQLGLGHSHAIVDGMEFVLEVGQELQRVFGGEKDGFTNAYAGIPGSGLLDYCALHDIQVQAWGPLHGNILSLASAKTPESTQAAELLTGIAADKGVTPAAIALAWLLRHPAGIVPIFATSSPEHLIENCAADTVTLSRSEWYALFAAAGRLTYRAT